MNRKEFEKWFRSTNHASKFDEDDEPGIIMWGAWQACSRLYAKLTAEPTPEALTLPGDFFSKEK